MLRTVKMRTAIAVFGIISFLSLAALSSAKTTTACHEEIFLLQGTCTSTQYILIHSVESQEVSSCNDNSSGALWSRSGLAVHFAWEWCNLQKERCTNGKLSNATYLRMNYTCVDELSSIRRFNMCSDVSVLTSTPVYLQSPGYPAYYTYTNAANCTCSISVSQNKTVGDFWLTLYDMFTQLPETLTLKLSNGTNKKLTTVADNTGYILNQETTNISPALSVSFVPRFPGQGYFWIGLESRAPVNIAITCNEGLGTSPTLPPTTPTTSVTANSTATTVTNETTTPTTKTTTTNETATTETTATTTNETATTETTATTTNETTTPTTKTTTTNETATTETTATTTNETTTPTTTTTTTNETATMVTAEKTSMTTTAHTSTATTSRAVTPAAVGMTKDDLKIIYIVVPTAVIAIVITIVIVVIIKKRQKSNHAKFEDTVRFSVPDYGVESLYAKENFAMDMVDKEIYESQESLGNGSLSGPVSSYGVGVAFGTFKGENVRQRSSEGEEKEMHRGMFPLPKSVTFGGEDLLLGVGAAVPSDGGEVIYAQINKPKKNKNPEDDRVQGQTSIPRPSHSNERQDQLVSDSNPVENETDYSLADDFDDPNKCSGVGSRSNDGEDADVDYAYAYARRRRRGNPKRREPQKSLLIYDDIESDDSEFAESDIDGVFREAIKPHIERNDHETECADGITDYDELEFEDQKHKRQLDDVVHVQRTEL
ncbi:mucin-5AC-like [Lineus longissimus]|uniref:mucin-5AC-like n=1 Tax=Lineus longissimus TaxID=88925 RepID=UPI00315DB643